jgi:hypothetical protein
MSDEFRADDFIDRLNRGEYDDSLHETIRKLSFDQLEQVALLMLKRIRANTSGAV